MLRFLRNLAFGRADTPPPKSTPPPTPQSEPESFPDPDRARSFKRHKVIATWTGTQWDPPNLFYGDGVQAAVDLSKRAKRGDELWWYTEVDFSKQKPGDHPFLGGGAEGFALMRQSVCIDDFITTMIN